MLNVIYVNDQNNASTSYEVKDNTIISGQGIAALYGFDSCEIASVGCLINGEYKPNAFFTNAPMYFVSKVDGLCYLAGTITGSHTYR